MDPVTEIRLIRLGLSIHRLREQIYDVFDRLLAFRFGLRLECLTRRLALGEDLLTLGLDFLAGLRKPLLLVALGRVSSLLEDTLGLFARLGDALFALRFGLGDDLVGLALGLLYSVENLWPGHSYVKRRFGKRLFGSCETAQHESGELCYAGSYRLGMGVLEDKARARLFYKYLSRVYDTINPFIWNEEMRDEALEWFGIGADDRVLDVGCGTGFATEGLLERTGEVYALDQSAHQLEQAYAKFGKRGRVRFHRGDAERLPFRDDSFDAYWSSGSIEYWPNPVDALREARRVTKPGGPVLVVGPDYPKSTVFARLADTIMLFYDEEEADRMFEQAGFETFEHRIQQRRPGTPRAITTLASVPE